MEKILFVVLDESSANGICIMNVAKCLVNKGYYVDVLTTGEKTQDKFLDNVRIIHIPPKLAIRLREIGKRKNNQKLVSISSYLYQLQVAFTSLFIWPWNSPIFTIKLFSKVKNLHREQKYSMIIPVYTQFDAIIAGYWLKQMYQEILYIPYFLDSLSGGATPRLLSNKQKLKMGLKWERKLLRTADGIIAMKSSEDHHKRYSSDNSYFKKMIFLDVPMLVEQPLADGWSLYKNNFKHVVFTYLGSMPLSIRNPYYGIKLLQEIRTLGYDISLNIVGDIPPSDEYVDFCRERNWVQLIGKVPHNEIYSYVRKSDILINFGNNISEMVPCKIFEYMSYGKPILSFSPSSCDPSITYLERYLSACIINETDDISENKSKIIHFLNSFSKTAVPFWETEKKFYLNTPECFAEYISSLDGGK